MEFTARAHNSLVKFHNKKIKSIKVLAKNSSHKDTVTAYYSSIDAHKKAIKSIGMDIYNFHAKSAVEYETRGRELYKKNSC